MLRYLTAGESHGDSLLAILEHFPAGVSIDEAYINRKLKERQGGVGRGGRMEIEADKVKILSGVRKGISIGSPIALQIKNKDYTIDTLEPVFFPRPGHADLSGLIKYDRKDIRDILERASARETAIRVACGAVGQLLLKEFDIAIVGHVVNIGGVAVKTSPDAHYILTKIKKSSVRCVDAAAEKKMITVIKQAQAAKDSLGGIFEVLATNVPVGLGSHGQWDGKLDARIAAALMSIQGVKGVEIGEGFQLAFKRGSQAHDEIYYAKGKKRSECGRFVRRTNYAGGIEGGMSNGNDIIVRGVMKPIPTLGMPLHSVDIRTKLPHKAAKERADVCAVPACSIIGEAVVAIELARAFLEKFGGDSLSEIQRNYQGYIKQVSRI